MGIIAVECWFLFFNKLSVPSQQVLIAFRMAGAVVMAIFGGFSHDSTHPDPCTGHNSTHSAALSTANFETFDGSFSEATFGINLPVSLHNGTAPSNGGGTSITHLSVWQSTVVVLFLVQMGLFNSTQPQAQSILMDYVRLLLTAIPPIDNYVRIRQFPTEEQHAFFWTFGLSSYAWALMSQGTQERAWPMARS